MIAPLILYINLENTLIPREMFRKMISNGKEGYYTAIRLMDPRVCLVAPAKDWVMLSIANPSIIDLINERGITIMPTLFSHVLPDLFPETLEMQFALSSNLLGKSFEKIVWSGIIPENTVSSTIAPFAKKRWESIIFSVGHNNLRGLRVGHYSLKGSGSDMPLDIIANAPARLKYMQMYREECSARSVMRHMEKEDLSSTCLFDFERPWSNVVYYPHCGKSSVRMDMWKHFHAQLSQSAMNTWRFSALAKRQPLFLDNADLGMWLDRKSEWLIDIQRDVVQHNSGRGDYFELAALVAESSMPPRVLTRFMQDDSFPSTYHGKPGIVDLVGDVSKVKELLFLCKNIRQKRRVDYGMEFLPVGERLYLNLLHKALLQIEKQF